MSLISDAAVTEEPDVLRIGIILVGGEQTALDELFDGVDDFAPSILAETLYKLVGGISDGFAVLIDNEIILQSEHHIADAVDVKFHTITSFRS